MNFALFNAFYIISDNPVLKFNEGLGKIFETLADAKVYLRVDKIFEPLKCKNLKIYSVSGDLKFEEIK